MNTVQQPGIEGTFMDVTTIALFALTELTLSLAPGPAVVLVVSLSIRQGRHFGYAATLGILTTNALFFSLSAIGVGAVIIASSNLFLLLKWLGAAYLMYLGFGMLKPLVIRVFRKDFGQTVEQVSRDENSKATQSEQSHSVLKQHAFWKGFSIQASNPGNLAFFVAILPQFVDPNADVVTQMVVLGVISVMIELPVLAAYVVASAYSARLFKNQALHFVDGLGGGILIAIGVTLVTSQRPN